MLLVSADHGKAVAAVVVSLGTLLLTTGPDIHLIDGAAGGILLNPAEQTHQRCPITLHGTTRASNLCLVLDGLERGYGRWQIDFLAFQRVGQRVAHLVGVDEHHIVLTALEIAHNIVIVTHAHTIVLEMCGQFLGHLLVINKERRLLLADIGMRNGYWCEVNIRASHVEQPCNLVEGADEHGIGTIELERAHEPVEFALDCLTGQSLVMNIGLAHGAHGSVGPDAVGRSKV